MIVPAWITTSVLVLEYVIKVVAIGVVPENRRPSSSQAWLLLILFLPAVGLPLFLLIGSPYVTGRRHRLQSEANRLIRGLAEDFPTLPQEVRLPDRLTSVVELNRNLGAFPCVEGTNLALHHDPVEFIAAVTQAVERAERYVHVEIYIMALDHTTEPFFDALAAAVRRGVRVRVLFDHLGTRGYPGYRAMKRRMTAAGIEWHPMMPIAPLRGRWRRPDLRNHRKLVVVDGWYAFMGSQNMIDPGYLRRRNVRLGRHWVDLNIELAGPIVHGLDVVFATDWYAETARVLGEITEDGNPDVPAPRSPANRTGAFQLLPSGPGFPTQPNLRMFDQIIASAHESVTIVSPYFVPDESLLAAITTAAYRGVRVELFVSEKADQFMVHHAQRSYYAALLEAGVRIYRYPAPAVLHTKVLVVDDRAGIIGSSNMDFRSFALDYEISLLGFDEAIVPGLNRVIEGYRDTCHQLTSKAWAARPLLQRYLDNVMRLTAALQ